MSTNQPINPTPVDRREEVVVTEQPGYQATEQVTVDVAAERRIGLFQINRVIWSILTLLEVLLGLRFALKLISANPDSGFAAFIYSITNPFIAPFANLIGTPSSGAMVFEVTTLIAMAIYALIFWGVVRVITIIVDRLGARMVTRSVREETPGGVERTTYTTKND
jgi:uncharacterized membrane protein